MTRADSDQSVEKHIARLHAPGIVDLHFDLPMDLYEKRDRTNVLATEFLPEFEAGDIGVLAVAIFVEDRYLPDRATQVGLDQITCLKAEAAQSDRFSICWNYQEIINARASGKIAL